MAKKMKATKDPDGERCPECGGVFHDCRTDDPYDDETRCVDCGYLLRTISHSREFGPRFEEIQAANAAAPAADEAPDPDAWIDLAFDLSDMIGQKAGVQTVLGEAKGAKRAVFERDLIVAQGRVGEAEVALGLVVGAAVAERMREILETTEEDALSIREIYDKAMGAAALPEYPHCECGAILAMDTEKARGKCEACAPIPVDPAPTLYNQAGEVIDGKTEVPGPAPQPSANPVNVPLPFPPAPCEPFDFHAAFLDIGKKNRDVEARQKAFTELNERAKDSKKQWEAAASSLTLAISEYDRKAREAEEAGERQASLQAAYVEKLEADAAAQASPELPMEPPAQTAEGRVFVEGLAQSLAESLPEATVTTTDKGEIVVDVPADAATPLSDALPACACGAALVFDTELETGKCDECPAVA